MNRKKFIQNCTKNNYSDKDIETFKKAIQFSSTLLENEKRLAGDSVLDHNVRVGCILARNKSDPDLITTAILSHTQQFNQEETIKKKFGSSIVEILQQGEELEEIKGKVIKLDPDATRKVILSTLKDIRVIVLKLAQKIDNMKTAHVFPPSMQKALSQEVLDLYAPLAYRLGMDKMRVDLENIAFKILNPRKYREIARFLEQTSEERQKSILEAIELIKQKIGNVKIKSIKGRPKHIYSINKKMLKKKLKLPQIHDLLGIRIIVPSIKDCYTTLGILHENFEQVEGRLKDYIANPKSNFYRSIHTGVKLPTKKIAEIQIRTPEMHEFAEEGIAAHWRYKGIKSAGSFDKKMAWLKSLLELQKTQSGKELLESVKVDLFADKIYCYTPKGDVKELPQGATLLDFAFSVHEQVGNTAVGGRINGKFFPIKTQLKSGDVVEIVTNKNQRPRRSWIKIVASPKSRQKIRKSLQQYEELPAFHFRRLKPTVKEEQGVLVQSQEFPKAICVLAKCCRALPGDQIVGIVTKRRVISVHKEECKSAQKEQKRWVPVEWRETFNQRIGFHIEAMERSGLLADLLHTIANAGFEAKEAKAKLLGQDYAQCSFKVIPRSITEIQQLIRRVVKVRGVKRIYFE